MPVIDCSLAIAIIIIIIIITIIVISTIIVITIKLITIISLLRISVNIILNALLNSSKTINENLLTHICKKQINDNLFAASPEVTMDQQWRSAADGAVQVKIDCTVHSNPPSQVIIPMMKSNQYIAYLINH